MTRDIHVTFMLATKIFTFIAYSGKKKSAQIPAAILFLPRVNINII